eukprot:s610_g10.t1
MRLKRKVGWFGLLRKRLLQRGRLLSEGLDFGKDSVRGLGFTLGASHLPHSSVLHPATAATEVGFSPSTEAPVEHDVPDKLGVGQLVPVKSLEFSDGGSGGVLENIINWLNTRVGDFLGRLCKTTTTGRIFPLPSSPSILGQLFPLNSPFERTVLRVLVFSLNSLNGEGTEAGKVISEYQESVLRGLMEDCERIASWKSEDKMPDWSEFFRVKGVDYKGEEVLTAQSMSWKNVSPALPPEVGSVPLEDVVELGCRHYVLNFEDYLLDPEDQEWCKPPRVLVPLEDWEEFCAQLLDRGVFSRIHEDDIYKVGAEAELRKDRPFSVANPVHRIYLDNFDELERTSKEMAETIQGKPSALVQGLQETYAEMGIPRHPKKGVARQTKAEVQGAIVDGRQGIAYPKVEKVLKYAHLTKLLLEKGTSSQKQMQIVGGGLVYIAMFRRPLLGSLNHIWQFILDCTGYPPVVQFTLPPEVVTELSRFLGLLPLAYMNFRSEISPMVTASDASQHGGGVTASEGLTPWGITASACNVRGDVVEPCEITGVLTIGLFDSIGALRVAADALGWNVHGHISVEKSAEANRVVESHFPGAVVVSDVHLVDHEMVKQWSQRFTQVSLVVLGAGPPCQGVSGLNASRKGALRDERSALFSHVARIRDLVRKCFPWAQVQALMESVASMDLADENVMTASFGSPPWHIDAAGAKTLVSKLLTLVSMKGEDISLQTASDDLVKYHRLRSSIPAKLWRWKAVAAWRWTGSKEHINVLEMRAVLTALRWRLERHKKLQVHSRLATEDLSRLVELCGAVPWLALPMPGDAPLLKGGLPFFLGGFMPEAVKAAQVISKAAAIKADLAEFLEVIDKAGEDGPWRFACFCASSAFLCGSQTPEEDNQRQAARDWFQQHPRLQAFPPLLRAQSEALPAEMRHQLEVAPMQMLTALHLAAALLAAPSSGFSEPFKALACGGLQSGFLPAMPEDENEVILRALHDGNPSHRQGHTRYRCSCGFIYVVADCGAAVQESRCPACHRTIGGWNYAERNNQRLDSRPQLGQNNGQAGYFQHEASRDRRHSVRQLTPLPYRALHFLLHSAMLGPCFQEAPPLRHLQSILQHLTADWMVLTELLDGSSAPLLMDLAERLLYPSDSLGAVCVLSSSGRSLWERRVAEAVVMPCVDTTRRADFDAKLEWAASVGSMEDALPRLLKDRLPPMGISTCNTGDEDTVTSTEHLRDLPELLTINGRFLELGCGDLSFARSLVDQRRRAGTASNGFHFTTSMLEPWDVVRARYNYSESQPDRPSAESHRRELERRGLSTVMEHVDGTSLLDTFPLAGPERFDVVIFNFPYGGTFDERIGPKTLAEHIRLVDGVFQSAKPLLTKDGSIWITLLSSQIRDWGVEDLARRRGLVLAKRSPFPWSSLPGYHPVWGDSRDFERNQPWQSYTDRNNAILCCFVQPDTARRRDGDTGLTGVAAAPAQPAQPVPADLPVRIGCSRMLRLVDKPTISRLERDFQGAAASGGPAARHPLLRAVLEAGDELQLVAHLADILEWQRFVKRHFEYLLSREEARKLKVRDALHKLESEQKRSEDVKQGRQLFQRFQNAWALGKSHGCMARYGCIQLPDAPEMSLESPLGLSCADETENLFIVALVSSLVDTQNAFLNQVLDIAGAGELPAARAVRSVLEYWFHPGLARDEGLVLIKPEETGKVVKRDKFNNPPRVVFKTNDWDQPEIQYSTGASNQVNYITPVVQLSLNVNFFSFIGLFTVGGIIEIQRFFPDTLYW